MESNGTSSSEHQALFHERLFGIDDVDRQSYLAATSAVRHIVTADYRQYFGCPDDEIVCEIGAGRGHLLKALLDEGYFAIGCEYSERLVAAGRSAYGLPADVFLELNAWELPAYLERKAIRPTVLVMWHVVEHIQNSLALLELLIKACADKITLIFQTPLPVPNYVFAEHIFFPTTETYHFIAERLGLSIRLLYVIPYTRYVTCVMSNKDLPTGKIFPKQQCAPGFSAFGQLIEQLDAGLQELDLVTKEQYATIVALQSPHLPVQPGPERMLTLASDLSQIAEVLQSVFSKREEAIQLEQKVKVLMHENQVLRLEFAKAAAQLDLLKEFMLTKYRGNSL